MKKNGRLPQIFAPEAVKNVVNPIQNTPKPMIKLAAMSKLTWYFCAITVRPGVTIGPRLLTSAMESKWAGDLAHAVVAPELKARRIMIDSFHMGDLIWLVETQLEHRLNTPIERIIGAIRWLWLKDNVSMAL